jgi:hypothetical protein
MRSGTLFLRDLDALVIAMGPYHTSVNHNAGITFAIFKGLTMPHPTTAVIGCTKNLARNCCLASDLAHLPRAAITDGAVQPYFADQLVSLGA